MGDLYLLVKSMSKSEKRYFKLYSSSFSKEGADYLRLFDLIDGAKNYDEDKLKKKLQIKNFSFTKRYLFDAIIKCLRTYLTEDRVGFQLLDAFKSISILRNRGLLKEAIRLYEKTETQLIEQNLYTFLIELQHTGEVLYSLYLPNKNIAAKLEEIAEKRRRYIKQLQMLTEYQLLSRDIRNAYRNAHPIRVEGQGAVFLDFVGHPLLKDNSAANSPIAQNNYYESLTLCFTVLLDYEKVKKYSRKAVDLILMESNKSPVMYKALFTNSSNLLLACSKTKDWESYQKYSNIFSTQKEVVLGKLGIRVDVLIKKLEYIYLLNYYIERNDFESIVNIKDEVEAFQNDFGDFLDIDWKMTISFIIGQALFFLQQFEEALIWIEIILNEEKNNPKIPCLCNARILKLLIHYEMGNYFLLSSLFRSTYRFLNKNERLFESERLLLNYFKWVGNYPNGDLKKKKEEVLNLLNDTIADNKYEKNFYEELKLNFWRNFSK